jgi:hypothetical protein
LGVARYEWSLFKLHFLTEKFSEYMLIIQLFGSIIAYVTFLVATGRADSGWLNGKQEVAPDT